MIIKTIELINEKESEKLLTIEELQTQLDNGDFDDIITSYEFLIMTDMGVVKVSKDKTIVKNVTVDLSNYTLQSELPKLEFDENGDLVVTINNVTKKFTPMTETQ